VLLTGVARLREWTQACVGLKMYLELLLLMETGAGAMSSVLPSPSLSRVPQKQPNSQNPATQGVEIEGSCSKSSSGQKRQTLSEK
jgi:hypothetical protein